MQKSTHELTITLNGQTELPPSKVAAIVTFLAMQRPADPPPIPVLASGLWLERIMPGDTARYIALFRAVGEPWLWVSRLKLSEAELARFLAIPGREAYAVMDGAREIGLVELDATLPDLTELAFFGLVPDATGRGLGGQLMRMAQAMAFSRPNARMTVNTCTLDDPRALGFYQRAGFKIIRQAVEVFDDPRLSGLMPLSAAPQIPIIRPAEPA
ncbi:MAG: GNAT family N-acetyltransferase [Bosea sp. (in: a-proteobacteria)]